MQGPAAGHFQQLQQQQQQQQHQQQQQPHPQLHQQLHQQTSQYAAPPAPTFASLGGTSLPYLGNLGSLAQGHQLQNIPGAQGLSAAIPPSAYLMQQSQQLQQQHQQQQQQLQHHQQHHVQQHQQHQQHQLLHQQQQHPHPHPHPHHLPQPQQQQHQQNAAQKYQPAQEKRSTKREDANYGLVLPLHKVKRLIKSESSVKAISGEASFAIARAAELLLEQLLEKAYSRMSTGNRASIDYDDIAATISKWTAADFLRDMVPETQTLSELIERVKRQDAATSKTKAGKACFKM